MISIHPSIGPRQRKCAGPEERVSPAPHCRLRLCFGHSVCGFARPRPPLRKEGKGRERPDFFQEIRRTEKTFFRLQKQDVQRAGEEGQGQRLAVAATHPRNPTPDRTTYGARTLTAGMIRSQSNEQAGSIRAYRLQNSDMDRALRAPVRLCSSATSTGSDVGEKST